MLPFVGYHSYSENPQLCNIIKQQKGHWHAVWTALGFSFDPSRADCVWGKSRFPLQLAPSASSSTQDELASSEQEYWFKTPGLVCLLLHWASHRTDPVMRMLVDGDRNGILQQHQPTWAMGLLFGRHDHLL